MADGVEKRARPTRRPGVRNQTLRQQVFEYLREEILSNRLEPGTELNELALSRELEVSRGPVREALNSLASEGLVKITPRRGATVAALTPDEFVGAYQVREALETLAIRLAVPRLQEGDIERLRELHQDDGRGGRARRSEGVLRHQRRLPPPASSTAPRTANFRRSTGC